MRCSTPTPDLAGATWSTVRDHGSFRDLSLDEIIAVNKATYPAMTKL